jgi:hypothetical protein
MHKDQYRDLLDTLITPYAKKAALPLPQGRDDTIERYTRNMLAWYVRHDPRRLSAFINRYARSADVLFQITDKEGATLTLYPVRRQAVNKKRRIYLNSTFEHNVKDLKRFAFQKIIEDDIKKSLTARRQRQRAKPRSVSAFIFREPRKDRLFSSGSFEHDFKNMVIRGKASNMLGAAKEIVTAMTPAEKKDLNSSLKSSGIRTVGDLENLLSRWKGEALSRPRARTYKREITRAKSPRRSFSIAD